MGEWRYSPKRTYPRHLIEVGAVSSRPDRFNPGYRATFTNQIEGWGLPEPVGRFEHGKNFFPFRESNTIFRSYRHWPLY